MRAGATFTLDNALVMMNIVNVFRVGNSSIATLLLRGQAIDLALSLSESCTPGKIKSNNVLKKVLNEKED